MLCVVMVWANQSARYVRAECHRFHLVSRSERKL